ncbi:MAG: RsmB/NOP family class I SAM-dependent RNA methyltransferase [Planctomycetota bacterium]
MTDDPAAILPPVFLAAMRDAAGDRADAVLAAFAGDRQPAFRANTLKGKAGDLVKDLRALGIPFAKHKLSDWSFTTTAAGEAQLKESEPYKAGRLYSQGIASQLPALLGELREGDRVLDACAAPGGKATLLAMRLGNAGAGLTALDRAPGRFGILAHTFKLMGATKARALCADAREPPPAIRNTRWDHILVDAPCTGSGTVRIANEKGWQHLGIDYEAYVTSRAYIQTALVERAASMLAPGGTLVYSTCSLDPRENEAVVEHLLHLRAPLELVDLSAWSKRFGDLASPAIPAFRGRTYSAALSGCLRLWPSTVHEGFFVGMLKRRK